MITYQCELFQIVLLHQTADEAYQTCCVQRKRDEPMVGHKRPQHVLREQGT